MNEANQLRDEQNQENQVVETISNHSGVAGSETPQVEIIDLEQPQATSDAIAVEVAAVEVAETETPERSAPDHSSSVASPAEPVTEPVDILVTSEELDSGILADDEMEQATREELLVQNRELMGWVNQLEAALAECQADFKANLHHVQEQEDLLEARTAELMAVQGQNTSLGRDVEAAQKSSQRQRILVETMTAQLEASQERIAQMERECTLAQRRCADQAQQLLQAESLCRDLKSRLNRQQRHTLQFKAALEKSLEVSVSPTNFDLPDLDVEPMDQADDFFPRPKPVKPWSQKLDEAELEDLIHINTEGQDEDTEIVLDNVEPVFDPNAAETLETTLKSGPDQWAEVSSDEAEVKAPARVSFVPPIVPTAPIPSPAGLVAASLDGTEAGDAVTPKDADEAVSSHEVSLGTSEASDRPATEEMKSVASVAASVARKAEMAQAKQPDASTATTEEEAFEPAAKVNWPAPLVNPLRPTKKIGSLAAIDLPSFPKAQV